MKNHGRESISTLGQTMEQHRQGWDHFQPHLTATLTQRRKVPCCPYSGTPFPNLTAITGNGSYSTAMGHTLCPVHWAFTGSPNL